MGKVIWNAATLLLCMIRNCPCGLCQRAARAADLPKEEIDAFREEATAGDYNHLLQTAMRWFNID
jgi:hypothetical protein